MNQILLLIMLIALLSACATPYRCPLTNEEGYCVGVADTYKAALSNGGDSENVLAGTYQQARGSHLYENELIETATYTGYDTQNRQNKNNEGAEQFIKAPVQHPLEKKPVYSPPSVWRLWTAPWTDKVGILHGGENLYFNTPGKWNYGTLREPGNASGLIGPINADMLGFSTGDNDRSTPSFIAPTQNLFEGK